MPDHALLKLIHVTCVTLSITGFSVRAGLMLLDSSLLYQRWIRTLPHIIDSILFFSGLWMAINLHQYPGSSPWLSAKLSALLLYIVAGAIALRGKNKSHRLIALVVAYLSFGYMLAVAITRNPLPVIP